MTQNETRRRDRVALVTGGSHGLGRALVTGLDADGWRVITDGRRAVDLREVGTVWGDSVETVPGDVTDPAHRDVLVDAVERAGRLDLLVHNASTLGPSPLPGLADVGPAEFEAVLEVNAVAPLALTTRLLPALRAASGVLIAISSDAAVEHYPGWGLYGASKAALDHLVLTMAEEVPGIRAYAVDPGDMRTQMHQDAFPGEDIGDRPLPEVVVPHLLALLRRRPRSGRLRAADVPIGAEVA